MRRRCWQYRILRIVLAFMLVVTPMSLLATDRQEHSERYQQCVALTRSNPAEAMKQAQAWHQSSQHSAARHCRALALYAMQKFVEAERELKHLATEVNPEQQRVLWLQVMVQYALTQKMQHNIPAARKSLNHAMAQCDEDVAAAACLSVLAHRGKLLLHMGENLRAIQDFDHALSLDAVNAELYALRGKAFHQLGKRELAIQDYKRALEIQPGEARAREGLQLLR